MLGRKGETRRRVRATTSALLAWAVVSWPSVAEAQRADVPTSGPEYEDAGAGALHRAAVAYHMARAERLTGYQGMVRQRVGVRLRTPLKDRTLYHAESAYDVTWRKDGPVTVAALGIRETTPAGLEDEIDLGMVDEFWDPQRDRLLLGSREPEEEEDPDDFSIEHPLEPESAGAYRFASGDTLTVALPDGTEVRVVELRMTPRSRTASRLLGSLWVEPSSGALVRAAYRLSETLDALRDIDDLREEDERGEFRWVPGLFKPWTFDATVITVDYSLWDGDVWLPRRWRAEGVVRAGILEAPGELDRAFRFTWVGTEHGAGSYEDDPPPAEGVPEGFRLAPGGERRRNGQEVRILVPDDLEDLRESSALPPPVWDDAPGFVTGEEVDELVTRLDQAAPPAALSTPRWVRWGPQRPDLLRYNRVEEVSVGVRGAVLPQVAGRPISLEATVRLGTGDLHPNARLDATRVSLRRSLTLSGYHELAATDERARHLGPGNSAMALLAGRDDGDYYRRTGASLVLGPPPQRRPSWGLTLSSERHESVAPETRASLVRLWEGDAWAFRPNVVADEGWEHAVTLRLEPSTGADPQGVQAGLSWSGTAAAGPLGHFRTGLSGRLAVPMGADYRVGARAWGGVATDDVPEQRAFAVGGTGSLRGYAPRTLVGPCGAGGTLELQRVLAATALVVFADVGWAGPCRDLRADAALASAGLGISLLDGLVRADLSRGLEAGRGLRFDLYLDGPF